MGTLVSDNLVSKRLRERDRAHVWHPWSPADLDRSELMLVSASDVRTTDQNRHEYIDCASLNTTVGYGNEAVLQAALDQLSTSVGTDISIASHDIVGQLAERIASHLPRGMNKSLFVNSGSEGCDAAVFIATSYWLHKNETRNRFVTFAKGYHGSTLACRTLSGLPRVVHPFDNPFDVTHVELPAPSSKMRTAAMCDELIARFKVALEDGTPPAAVLVEPILNVGGLIVLPDGFLERLSTLCRDNGTLLIVDEVYSAYGRCGDMFMSLAANAKPDVIVSSKGLASGYFPIAAVSVTDEIANSFALDPHIGGIRYGHTTSGHAPACATALATLDQLEKNGLCARVDQLGELFRAALAPLLNKQDVIDIRGVGLANGIEFKSYDAGVLFVKRMRERGILVRQPSETVIVSPPLIISETDMELVIEQVQDALATPL